MGLINVFTDDMHVHLKSFHQNLFLMHEQTLDKFALFLENLSNFSLVCFHYPDSQRYLPLLPTTWGNLAYKLEEVCEFES